MEGGGGGGGEGADGGGGALGAVVDAAVLLVPLEVLLLAMVLLEGLRATEEEELEDEAEEEADDEEEAVFELLECVVVGALSEAEEPLDSLMALVDERRSGWTGGVVILVLAARTSFRMARARSSHFSVRTT